MALLDTIVLIALASFVLWLFVRRNARSDRERTFSAMERTRGIRRGPVPGYAWIPPDALDLSTLHESLGDRDSKWELLEFEAFNSPERTRAVMRLRFYDHEVPPLSTLLRIAHVVQQATGVDVVGLDIVKHDRKSAPDGSLIFAPDGKGWHGVGSGLVVIEDISEATASILSAVPGTASTPGFGWFLPQRS